MNGNTPTLMQSEEARAPWNEPMPILHEYDVTVFEHLTRVFRVKAASEFDAEKECEGNLWTLDDLLRELKSYVEKDLDTYKGSKKMEHVCNDILKAIENYTIEDTEIVCL